MNRAPDFIIGDAADPYLLRWWVIPRNRIGNVYLHRFLRSDDDRALHDHPWASVSILLRGGYLEHVPADPADPGGPTRAIRRHQGDIVFRRPSAPHRIELIDGQPCTTLFLTGPKVRSWGFWCTWGWRHWSEFTAGPRGERVGRGCE